MSSGIKGDDLVEDCISLSEVVVGAGVMLYIVVV